jgi:hypothetical protein
MLFQATECDRLVERIQGGLTLQFTMSTQPDDIGITLRDFKFKRTLMNGADCLMV